MILKGEGMGSDNKQVDLGKYIDALTREVDDFEAKGYEFTRDADPTSTNDMWSEEFKAFADMSTIESLFFSEDWVYIVVDLIAQKISSQNLLVMKSDINSGVESVDYAANHPLNELINRPNEYQDYHSWMYNLVTQYILLGNSIIWYSKRMKQLVTLRTSQVQIHFDSRGSLESYILYGDDSFDSQTAQMNKFKREEIIHIRRPNPVSLIWGLSPFVPGRKSVLFNRYSTDYLNSFYLKQATPGMIVEMDRQVNEATALRQLRTFESAYTGRRNQRRTMILPKGVTAKPSSHTIADQRIVELINNNREAILALLKVPKHEVGLQESGSLGSQEYKTSLRNFWESTLKPTARMIEGALNHFFNKQLGEEYFLQFDLSDVEALQEDSMAKAEIAAKMLEAGATVNEVRSKIFELEPVITPGADQPYILLGKQSTQPLSVEQMDLGEGDPIEEKSIESDEMKLYKLIEGRKQGWVKSIDEEMENIVEGPSGRHIFDLSIQTLIAMGNIATSIVKSELEEVKTKAAKIPSQSELSKRIEEAFKEIAPEWEEEYTKTLISTMELGYNLQLALIFNQQDRDKIEALRLRDANKRRAILSARGLDGFAYMSQTQTEKIMSEILKGVEAKETVDQIAKRISNTFTDPELAASRSRTIARTETLTAVSIGQGATIENASEVIKGLRKGWLNMSGGNYTITPDGIKEGDGRIRDKHLSKDNGGVSGEIVAHDKTFSNGLRWPRDVRSSDPGQVINCRCTVVMLTPGENL